MHKCNIENLILILGPLNRTSFNALYSFNIFQKNKGGHVNFPKETFHTKQNINLKKVLGTPHQFHIQTKIYDWK